MVFKLWILSFQAKKVELLFFAMQLVSGGQSGHQGIPSTPYHDGKRFEKRVFIVTCQVQAGGWGLRSILLLQLLDYIV